MLYSYRVIPDRGSWMDVQFDQSGLIQIYLDRRRRRRKFYITTFFRAIGYPTNHDILKEFYTLKNIKVSTLLKEKDLSKYYTVDNVTNEAEEVIVGELLPLNEKSLSDLHNSGIESVEVAVVPPNEDYIFATMRKDPARNEDEALKAIYQRMRPGDPINYNNAKLLIKRLFFDNRRYDLGMVGRYKLNERLKLDIPADFRTLDPRDLIEATKMLIDLHHTNGPVDDIDHLGARSAVPVCSVPNV